MKNIEAPFKILSPKHTNDMQEIKEVFTEPRGRGERGTQNFHRLMNRYYQACGSNKYVNYLKKFFFCCNLGLKNNFLAEFFCQY